MYEKYSLNRERKPESRACTVDTFSGMSSSWSKRFDSSSSATSKLFENDIGSENQLHYSKCTFSKLEKAKTESNPAIMSIPTFLWRRQKSSWSTTGTMFSLGMERCLDKTCSTISFMMRCLCHSSRSHTGNWGPYRIEIEHINFNNLPAWQKQKQKYIYDQTCNFSYFTITKLSKWRLITPKLPKF